MFYIMVFSSWDDKQLRVEVTGDMETYLKRLHENPGGETLVKLVYFETMNTVDGALERRIRLGESLIRLRQLVQSANPYWKDLTDVWQEKNWRALLKTKGFIPGGVQE